MCCSVPVVIIDNLVRDGVALMESNGKSIINRDIILFCVAGRNQTLTWGQWIEWPTLTDSDLLFSQSVDSYRANIIMAESGRRTEGLTWR